MQAKLQSRPDLLLLLSLLLAILLTPVLDHGNWSRLVLAAVTFIPVVLSIVRLSQIKGWVWPSVLLALGNVIFVVAGNTFRSRTLNRNSMGISGCVLRTHGCGSFLVSQEFSFRRSGAALHCRQYLSVAWVAMGDALFSDRCFLSGFNPGGKPPSRPSDRAALFQPDNALDDWIRRYSAA